MKMVNCVWNCEDSVFTDIILNLFKQIFVSIGPMKGGFNFHEIF